MWPARRNTMRKKTERVSDNVSQRLRSALSNARSDKASDVPTASALCQAAGISRNTLYRYHRDILEELRTLQSKRRPVTQSSVSLSVRQLSDRNTALQLQIRQLAAVVDHYFCAWQEANALLQRREQEIASLLKAQKTRPTPLRPQQSRPGAHNSSTE